METLKRYTQFILYRLDNDPKNPDKRIKKPINWRTGKVHDAHDPTIWTTYDRAKAMAVTSGSTFGVGFVFTEQDPFFFIDIDSCFDGVDWSPLAKEICHLFIGAYVEISQSGRGLHIIGTGTPPPHKSQNKQLHIELYHTERFVALTGTQASGDESQEYGIVLHEFVNRYFSAGNTTRGQPAYGDWRARWELALAQGVDINWDGPADDNDLLRMALRSRSGASVFTNPGDKPKPTFADLWNNTAIVEPYYNGDLSGADAALAQHLAFWTGNDAERINRIMLRGDCGLHRDKYEREDYLPRTILFARGKQSDVLQIQTMSGDNKPQVAESQAGLANTGTVIPPVVSLRPLPLQQIQYPEQTERFKPVNSTANLRFLLAHYGITAAWNDMRHEREIMIPGFNPHWGDSSNAYLTAIVDLAALNNLPITRIAEQINLIAQESTYHPIMRSILTTPWDGQPRLERFLHTLQTNTNEYSHELVRRWMLGTVQAAFSERGYAQQGVLVLEGRQGMKKTAWVRALDPANCNAVKEGAILDPSNKDNIIDHMRHWIVEIAELDGTMRKTDIARLKAHITTMVDKVRFPYARDITQLPRRTSYIATVNDKRFLVDMTGNRRWWVVSVDSIELNHGLDMQQVWAETYALLQQGAKTWLDQDEIETLNQVNKEHEFLDPLEEKLVKHFDFDDTSVSMEVTTTTVLEILGVKNPSRSEATRFSYLLRKHCKLSAKRNHYCLPKIRV